jgi:AraC family transcriptional regulator, glycine betaine-responsive activator
MSADARTPINGHEAGGYRFGFLTLAHYSMIAVSNALEPLRMANRVVGREFYRWAILTLDGEPAAASNGLTLTPTCELAKAGDFDIVFVCGGINVRQSTTPALSKALRRLAQNRIALGSLCTGGYSLTKAGLLNNYHAAIHWEDLSALREEFPSVTLSTQLFVIDRDRYTCSGGIAPLDLMLNLIRLHLGDKVAVAISDQFTLERIRDDRDRQHIPLQAQIGACHKTLIKVASLMEANIEEPLSLDELADAVKISRRQIERLFKRHLGSVPTRYYLEVRLRRARELLLMTNMSIMDIAVACGFQSPPHFSKCYRSHFSYPPGQERQRMAPSLRHGNGAIVN